MIDEQLIRGIFLLDGLSVNEQDRLIGTIKPTVVNYKRGESIYTPGRFDKSICFVLLGECLVFKQHAQDKSIPLNTVRSGESFGILAALGTDEIFPTHVSATKDSTLLFITDEDLKSLISSSSTVAMNVIRFLTGRITFLNSKISAFSGDNAEQKVASIIYSMYLSCHKEAFDFNKKRTAESLNLGRASMYRALESLKLEGVIDFDNKKIYITDLNGLERIAK